jgi:hypothetical protein
MKIETLDALEQFVAECNSIKAIEKVVSASLGVHYVMWSNTSINDVKESTIQFINDFKNEQETPIFLITNLKVK